ERLDDVARLDVAVAFEREAALVAFLHLADVVLEALERREAAFPDLDVVANQAYLRRAAHEALRDRAAGDGADLGDVEDLADLGAPQHLLLEPRREHARHGLLHVVERLVDDVVELDVDMLLLRKLRRLAGRTDMEADDDRAAGLGQVDVGL